MQQLRQSESPGLTGFSRMTVAEIVGTGECSRESTSLVHSDVPCAIEGLKDGWVCMYYKMTENDVNKSP